MTYDGLNSYLYDAEGRICAVKNSTGGLTGYVYDAAGIRVARLGLRGLSCNFAPGGVAWDIHASCALGQGSEQVAEFNGGGTWQHSNVYAGKLLGTYDTKGLHFYLDDWLGTRRLQTNSTGQLELTCQSLPYGNGQNCITTSLTTADNPTEQFFTGKERDTESGNDYFGARYYASSMGRFLSPDWAAKVAPVPYAKLDDPQSLNLYAYVRNNPLSRVDADGHCDQSGAFCKAWTSVYNWATSSHSASASASASAGQGSGGAGPLSVDAKVGTAQAKASASYGKDTSASAGASASVAETTIKVTDHSTTQVDALTANASASAGVSLGGSSGLGIHASAGANADVLSGSETGTFSLGPVTFTGTATGNVGIGANASGAIGTGGISGSAGATFGYGGALSFGVSWSGVSASGGASVKGTADAITTKVNTPEVQ